MLIDPVSAQVKTLVWTRQSGGPCMCTEYAPGLSLLCELALPALFQVLQEVDQAGVEVLDTDRAPAFDLGAVIAVMPDGDVRPRVSADGRCVREVDGAGGVATAEPQGHLAARQL